MHMEQLVNILKGGNYALERILSNLLAEDVQLVEYTDDSVLFIKNNHLVIATFKHPLTEAMLTSDDIIDNKIIYISRKDVVKNLQEQLHNAIAALSNDDFLTAKELSADFLNEYYQYHILSTSYPFIFTEALAPMSKGFELRKRGFDSINQFKGAIFALSAVNESADSITPVDYVNILESFGPVLALGKAPVTAIVSDALFGNTPLAESIVATLYEMAEELPDTNKELQTAFEDGYDLEAGKYPDEDEVSDEDYAQEAEEDEAGEETEDEQAPEFAPFDPSKLTDEETQQLHINTLKSVLQSIYDFVVEKANDATETTIEPDTDTRIKADLDKLESNEVNAEELASIEARWMPVLDYFLSSDIHRTEEDEFALPLDSTLAPSEETPVDEIGATGDDQASEEDTQEKPEEEPQVGEEVGK